ncbi:hypothetical protein MN608_05352 [Microdochium nivale]|nr:hypothetical protein MN608_05352 [Microdochium nivale]
MIRNSMQRRLMRSTPCSGCITRILAGTTGSRARIASKLQAGGSLCASSTQPNHLPELQTGNYKHSSSSGEHNYHQPPPPPRPDSTRLQSAILLGPIYISLALLSGEGLADREGEASQWANIISDIVTPPSLLVPEVSSYSHAINGGGGGSPGDEGYDDEDDGENLLSEEGQEGVGRVGSKLARSQASPAELWRAHMQRFFGLGVHHLGIYFRTKDVEDHGPLPLSGDAAAWYGSNVTTRLISAEDDLPPAQYQDRDGSGSGSVGKGRFVLAQVAFHDVGTEEHHDDLHATIQHHDREEFRPGKCAGAMLDDLERRLHQLGASRALLLTLDEEAYHTVYWDGRRFVTVLFLEFSPLQGP